MPWTWRYEDERGDPVDSTDTQSFPTQADAESWVGESWRDLFAAGVQRVSLLEDGRVEYTMPLTPAG